MDIVIKNCNNVDEGKIEITDGALNVKYAINGTGKSTLAKAIKAFVENNTDEKQMLVPFKYRDNLQDNIPQVLGYESIGKIMVFNEKYVDEYIYRPDELIKDSFEIFVKTPDYEKHLSEIETMLNGIRIAFQKHPELDELINAFGAFLDGYGKAKGGYSAAGAIGKGVAKGNNIDNIPEGLEKFAPYLQNNKNVKWIKWQFEGKEFLDLAEQCPYCSTPGQETKEKILKVHEQYDAKAVEQLTKILVIYKSLSEYFSVETREKLDEIMYNVTGMTLAQKNYLLEIKTQVEGLYNQLQDLKRIGFYSLRTAEKIADELKKYKIELSYYSHLESDLSKEKVNIINQTMSGVLEKAGQLQGEIAQQKRLIKETIEMYNKEINEFLYYAGYKYTVSIEENIGNDINYKLVLKHVDATENVLTVKDYLSYGERNAFALVLFMYSVLKENPDLVVLDDPISSFDGNKKFAIINMLFMGKHSLKNRTVLLLTHEFNSVIDIIYNLPFNFSPAPKAAFLSTKKGILTEKEIKKENIQSFGKITEANLSSEMDSLNKLVYLRRLLEITEPRGLAWQLLSNVFHKRPVPMYHGVGEERAMTVDEVNEATNIIRNRYHISCFDYAIEYQKTQNMETLRNIYRNSSSNYEKLQIYRIMYNENSSNSVVKKYVNETFHVENDYLFQLNPCEYDTVPQYIIDECDKEILAEEK